MCTTITSLKNNSDYVFISSTDSNDGDIGSVVKGLTDFWIVRIDSSGNILWKTVLGGSLYDIPHGIVESADKGFVAVGESYSNNGNLNSNYGLNDCWVVKLAPDLLPLTIVKFTTAPSNSPNRGEFKAKLNWETANELNVSHFNIQLSTTGSNFINVGTVKANNKSYNQYSYTAPPPPEGGIAYYRIVAEDFDGRKTYSEVKQFIIYNSSFNITVYPNPTKGMVHIYIPIAEKGVWNIAVQDVMGKVIKTEKTAALTKTYNMIVSQQSGVYFVSLTNSATGKRIVEKVIVE